MPPAFHYRPSIDGLRALSILSVFIYHLEPSWLPGGFLGVDVFFVISGFLITSIIYKACKTSSFSLLTFFQRRIARLFPAFFLVSLLTLLSALLLYIPQDSASAGANLFASALSLANVKSMVQGNYFSASADAQPYLHYWSLAIEEQFYLLYPFLFALLFRSSKTIKLLPFAGAAAFSLTLCIAITQSRPNWAFYLLPTRAFELLAGCILAVASMNHHGSLARQLYRKWTAPIGLTTVILSFQFVREGNHFPSFWPLLPVLGAVAVLAAPANQNDTVERLLAFTPLVLIGRISYSLYLWHWPVFSFVDYHMCFASNPLRLGLKVVVSIVGSALTYLLIEKPARRFLVLPEQRRVAFVFLTLAVALCCTIGIAVRRANYVDASKADIASGGLIFNHPGSSRRIMLIGDSHGAMYGRVMRDICTELGQKLIIASVSGGDLLPSPDGLHGKLWIDALAVAKKERPDCVVFVNNWAGKLTGKPEKLALAIESLKPLTKKVVLLSQPPIIPVAASRESIRRGSRPPYFEREADRTNRVAMNTLVGEFANTNILVVDVSSHFEKPSGEVVAWDSHRRQLYHDDNHLSSYGAELVRTELKRAVSD
jgi:peptidoglycan/LPS O-acetylase OafA/YrhL